MRNQPLVSAIIPTYNRANLVTRAIDSILNQTYPVVEVIVVDDGSTDDTRDKLSAYKGRIRLVTQQNSGPSIARNQGLKVSSGEIITFLDSDDYWLPDKLSRQIKLLNQSPPDIPCCISNCEYSDGSGTTFEIAGIRCREPEGIWLNPAEVLSSRPVIFTQAIAVRREALERIGGFSSSLPFYCEDHELSLRLALAGSWAIIKDPLVVCRRAGPDSLGERAMRDLIQLRTDQVEVQKRFLELVSAAPEYQKLALRARCEHFRARVHLLIAKLQTTKTWRTQAMASALGYITKFVLAAYRRSPLYPEVQIQSAN